MPDCSANTTSPSGWIALAPNAILNIGGSHAQARLLHVVITSSSPGSSEIIILDSAISPYGKEPYTGTGIFTEVAGTTCIADISNDGWDNYINIHY